MNKSAWISVILTFVFAGSSISQGQAQIETSVEKLEFFDMSNASMVGKRPPLAGVIGTPYLSEKWVMSRILTKDGQLVHQVEVILNTYDNEVEIRKGGRHLRLPSYTIEQFETEAGKKYISIENMFPTLYLEGFMEIVKVYDETTLYKRVYCYKKDPTYVEGVGVGSRDYELIHKEEMYLANGPQAARLFNNHRKNVKSLRTIGLEIEPSKKVKLNSIEAVQQYLAKR